MRSRVILGSCLVAATAPAAPKAPAAPAPAALEDPCIEGSDAACKAHALDAFEKAFASTRAGTAEHPLRISYIGDSVTADDQITNVLRERLGALVGNGGPGFVFAVSPHPYNQHRALQRVVGGAWRVNGVSSSPASDRLLGLGGSAESTGGGAIRLAPAAAVTRVDVHYLAQPRGGSFVVLADGKELATVATLADKKRAAFAEVAVPPGAKRIELRARGRVRLFGATLEAVKGAVVDNLGVVNATAKQFAKHNLPAHWQAQLAHRASDLVIVMLGTNEAEWLAAKGHGMAEHERLFGELLSTIRHSSPRTSCLVVSPLDQLDWRVEAMPPRESIPAMVEAQRRAARAAGCAFWDTYQWMGGKGSSKQWFARGWVVKDFQHPTTVGAKRIADALFAGLTSR
ncbi:MAG TPA: GDSL-type esterase/lipase family protein [Kofleriaceae bacterium]|jgi:lysophospholipase L1-like esterase|nr:GDSL-type esterase/lipase family protein [Kofleriaceae bacterium]